MTILEGEGTCLLCFLGFAVLVVSLVAWQLGKVDEELQRMTFTVPATPEEFLDALVSRSSISVVADGDPFQTFNHWEEGSNAGADRGLGPSDEIKTVSFDPLRVSDREIPADVDPGALMNELGFSLIIKAGNRSRQLWSLEITCDEHGAGTRLVTTPRNVNKLSSVEKWGGNLQSAHFKITLVIKDMSGTMNLTGQR